MNIDTKQKVELGDFQTPGNVAAQVAHFLYNNGVSPSTVVEPTCGLGSFLVASLQIFGDGTKYYGFDLNKDYIAKARSALASLNGGFL